MGGAEIARRQTMHQGQVPLHTIRADIDYGFTEARTTLGRIGVKVWIYRGDIHPEPKVEEKPAEPAVSEKEKVAPPAEIEEKEPKPATRRRTRPAPTAEPEEKPAEPVVSEKEKVTPPAEIEEKEPKPATRRRTRPAPTAEPEEKDVTA